MQVFSYTNIEPNLHSEEKLAVQPLSVVDNLAFPPTHLTIPLDPAYPSFQELCMLIISSGEDRMTFHVFVFFLLFFLLLTLAWLGRLSALHLNLPDSRAGTLHRVVRRLLKPRTPRDCPACCLAHELRNEVVEELTTEGVRKTVLGRALHSSKTAGTEEI